MLSCLCSVEGEADEYGKSVLFEPIAADVAEEFVAHRVGVPVGPGGQVLPAVGGRVAEVLGQLPAVLPLGVAEQPADVAGRSRGSLRATCRPMRSATTARSPAHPATSPAVGCPAIARPRRNSWPGLF